METIRLLHTNDLHSHFENWPRIVRFLHEQQQHYQQQGDSVLTFDIGDALDRVHPLSEATLGQANARLMNMVGYDGVTIGNNEGLGLSHEALDVLYDEANFDVLLANMVDMRTQQTPHWAKQYKIVTTPLGTRIAVLGMTDTYILTYPQLDWYPQEVEATLLALLPLLQQQSDMIVLLSHLGYGKDQQLAQRFPEINVIIGAHSHHHLPEGERIGYTLLAAAGRYGDHVGTITVQVDAQRQIQHLSAQTTPIYHIEELDADYQHIKNWENAGRLQLQQDIVTHLSRDLSVEDQTFNALKALQDYLQVPVSFMTTGMFVEPLAAGPLHREALLQSMPHAIHPVKVTLTGAQLKTFIQSTQEQAAYLREHPVKGMGFRGKVFGQMRWRGLDIQRDGLVLYAGQPIQDEQVYAIGLLDHYLWIKYFPVLRTGQLAVHMEILLRELMANYYAQQGEKDG
jgi:2',3'-cyclic-nucleotide 2'-phosphodiesterase (5'-nucleotidase family)